MGCCAQYEYLLRDVHFGQVLSRLLVVTVERTFRLSLTRRGTRGYILDDEYNANTVLVRSHNQAISRNTQENYIQSSELL